MEHTLAEKIMHQLHITHNLMRRRGHEKREHHPHHGHEGHDAFFRENMRAQRHLLALLSEKNGRSQKELAEALHIRPSSLSELLSKLEHAGFIEKKTNEADKRSADVFLTVTGQEKIQAFKQKRNEYVESLFTGLNEEEQENLCTLLSKLNLSLEERQEAGEGFDKPHHRGHQRERFFHHFYRHCHRQDCF